MTLQKPSLTTTSSRCLQQNRSTELKRELMFRISALPASFSELFEQLPLNNQKLMNLIAIMNAHPLVEDFVSRILESS